MIAGHRWEYNPEYRGYECVKLPIGGVESHQWCVGCGCRIDDEELCRKGIPMDDKSLLHFVLETLACERGYPPIEAGTYAEYKLNKVNG